MADCKTSVGIVGRVISSGKAVPPDHNPIARMEVNVGDDCFVVVGRGEDMANQFAALQSGQYVKINGVLVSHKWKVGKNKLSTIHVLAETLEIVS